MSKVAGTPVLILKEGTTRQRGREAQRQNIAVARIIAEVVKTTLGPRGMDKMLVDTIGDITITNDGAKILDEIDIQHPAGKVLVNVAKTQDKEVGDGTTSVVVLAGALLKKAEELMNKNIHPTTIAAGYRKALDKAIEVLDKIAVPVDLEDEATLRDVASTSMRSKAVKFFRDYLSDLAVRAVKSIVEERDGKLVADVDNIQVIKKEGKSVGETQLINGVIIDKEVVHPGMPRRIKDAKIALLDCPLEIEKTEISAEINIRDPEQMKAFMEEETRMLRDMVNKVKNAGANVVFCQKGIDDTAQFFLAKAGILAVRRVKKSDMEKLSRATGARIVTNLEDFRSEDLGYAELVEERKIGEDRMVFVEGCKNPRSVAILIRGGLERVVDEAERSLHDALCVVADIIKEPKIVYGGGATEIEVARELRRYASQVGGREQMAIEAFAEALEVIPQTLAENGGHDPIDVLVALRAAHEKPNGVSYGVNVFTGEVDDMAKLRVIEPYLVKKHCISSAVEAAITILRIDDVVVAAKPPPSKKEEEKGYGEEY
ncbi:TCP-1/cpn60 chaperonin family protein [Candidatus Bathyarchaeota archaeon]|nr:TCP-1/cpn60 chaperonin family protein [Candidatus Bathyarchaeota archaeon]